VHQIANVNSLTLDYFAGSGTTGHAVINLNREDGGKRKFILVEMGDYFDTVLLPRIKKVTFSPEWKDGRPKRAATEEEAQRSPRIVKVLRLESYEDTLNNLVLRRDSAQEDLLEDPEAKKLREEYMLGYMLEVESRDSPSLLNQRAFIDPDKYELKVKPPGSDASALREVDLQETFNYLLGLRVVSQSTTDHFDATFERDGEDRLVVKEGKLKPSKKGKWWFRRSEGETDDGHKTLVIWRNRPGGDTAEGLEQDNAVLSAWFEKLALSSADSEFDQIYVNGDNNLENSRSTEDTWKVRMIEEEFLRLMFEGDE
jgi:adenine-specific DNA-methyltransferase